jgi:type II secretory pathway component PulM
MAESVREHRVQLGCGTLILIAIIVMIFSQTNKRDFENDVQELRGEVAEIKKLIEVQTGEIRQLREQLTAPAPKSVVEKNVP